MNTNGIRKTSDYDRVHNPHLKRSREVSHAVKNGDDLGGDLVGGQGLRREGGQEGPRSKELANFKKPPSEDILKAEAVLELRGKKKKEIKEVKTCLNLTQKILNFRDRSPGAQGTYEKKKKRIG